VKFFKDKGFEFEKIDNKYDPISRYRLPEDKESSPNFYKMGTHVMSGKDYTFVPQFDIVPWEFNIRFEWWKANNQNRTRVYWRPEEMSLEEFYNRKLKKVFVLL
jgi:hypothetical protein